MGKAGRVRIDGPPDSEQAGKCTCQRQDEKNDQRHREVKGVSRRGRGDPACREELDLPIGIDQVPHHGSGVGSRAVTRGKNFVRGRVGKGL